MAGCATKSTPPPRVASNADAPSVSGVQSASTSGLFGYVAGNHAWAQDDTKQAADFYLAAYLDDPGNVTIERRTFQLLLADSRFDEAVAFSRLIVEGRAIHGPAQMVLALDALKRRRYRAAERILGKTKGTGFEALIRPLAMAWIYAGRGNQKDALAVLQRLKEGLAFKRYALEHEALTLDRLGDTEAADRAYTLLWDESGSGTVRSSLAYISFLARHGRQAEAMMRLHLLDQLVPGHSTVRQFGETLRAGGIPQPLVDTPAQGVAEALYRTAADLSEDRVSASAVTYSRLATLVAPDFAEAHLLLAGLMERTEQLDAALLSLERIQETDPLFERAALSRALILDRLSRGQEARVLLDKLIDQNNDNLRFKKSLADLLRRQERYADARQLYDELIELSVKDGETALEQGETNRKKWTELDIGQLYYLRGVCLERLDDWEAAEADLENARRLRPESAIILNYLGYSWLDRGMNVDEATALIEKASELRPGDGFITDSLGWAFFKQGRFEEAVRVMAEAAAIEPTDPTIAEHYGDALWRVGRHIEARFQWRHAVSLKPDEERLAGLLDKVDYGLLIATTAMP
ncbi:MAG: tetratricopeptide repeat protein [Pseudomonadota bacterium]